MTLTHNLTHVEHNVGVTRVKLPIASLVPSLHCKLLNAPDLTQIKFGSQ